MIAQLAADEIAEQQQLLHSYRRTLAIYLRQMAEFGGDAYSPPALLNGVDDARRNIARIKALLRRAGIAVADDPDDQAQNDWAMAPLRRSVTPPKPRLLAQHPQRAAVLAGILCAAVALAVLLIRWPGGARFGLPPAATPAPTAQVFIVNGAAMEPTFRMGQPVTIAASNTAPLRRGAVILVAPFGKAAFLKRVIGLPGDTVVIRDGRVYVNGIVQVEPYVSGARTTCRSDDSCAEGKQIKVLDGSVFVLGDNRMNSSDSREFGPVPISQIKGQVQ
jgi:signal peptidase I